MPNPVLQKVIDQVTQTQGVIASAIELINSIAARIEKAKADAVANGATEAELVPFQTLADALHSDTQALASAVAANP